MSPAERRNRRTALLLSLVVAGMFGFGFALVPLYGLICDLTGIQSLRPAGAAARVEARPTGRLVTVKFDATVNHALPWEFRPALRSMRVEVGAPHQTTYVVHNPSARPVTGQAIPAVAPWQASAHFEKTECFCFTRQTLGPGEQREMPLMFVVSPDLPEGIDSLTLSYTFMKADGRPGSEPVAPSGQEG